MHMRHDKMPAASSPHWHDMKESHGSFGLSLSFVLLKLLPAVVMRLLAFPVGFFFWLFSSKGRYYSALYLERLHEADKSKRKRHTLKHILSFAIALTEKIEVWAGKFSFKCIHFQEDDVSDLVQNLEAGRGVMLIVSHLGNSELLRALADYHETGVTKPFVVNSVADFTVTSKFNSFIEKVNAHSQVHLINASDIGADTIIKMQDSLERGELIVIAGDRTSANTQNRFVTAPFLGKDAPFAYGSFLLAALLNVPTYFMFGLRQKDVSVRPHYNLYVQKSAVRFDCPRKERESRIHEMVAEYARALETHCRQNPYQWYNFFDFWAMPST